MFLEQLTRLGHGKCFSNFSWTKNDLLPFIQAYEANIFPDCTGSLGICILREVILIFKEVLKYQWGKLRALHPSESLKSSIELWGLPSLPRSLFLILIFGVKRRDASTCLVNCWTGVQSLASGKQNWGIAFSWSSASLMSLKDLSNCREKGDRRLVDKPQHGSKADAWQDHASHLPATVTATSSLGKVYSSLS